MSTTRDILDYNQIPKSPRWPLIGSVPYFIWAGGPSQMYNYIDNLHNVLGPIFLENLGQEDLLFINDAEAACQTFRHEGKYPEHLLPEAWTLYLEETGRKRGLFFMEGPEWAANRRMMNKVLTKATASDRNVEQMISITDNLIQFWKRKAPGEHLEEHMYNWIVDCVSTIILGNPLDLLHGMVIEFDSNQDKLPNNDAETQEQQFIKAIISIFKESSDLMGIPPKLARLLGLPVWNRFHKDVSTALDISKQYVANKIEQSKLEHDECDKDDPDTIIDILLKKDVDPETTTRLIADLFLAAADTTAQTAIWALYVLGKHPEICQKARQEIRDTLPEKGPITPESLNNLPYLNAFLKEVMRLYPMAVFLTRRLATDAVLNGYRVPAGTMVVPSVYSMGRNPNYFSDPLEVRPERWLDDESVHGTNSSEERPNCTKAAYMPWGLGFRSCIGKNIAEKELLVLLTKLLQEFEWTVDEEVTPVQRMVIVPSENVVLKLTPINDN